QVGVHGEPQPVQAEVQGDRSADRVAAGQPEVDVGPLLGGGEVDGDVGRRDLVVAVAVGKVAQAGWPQGLEELRPDGALGQVSQFFELADDALADGAQESGRLAQVVTDQGQVGQVEAFLDLGQHPVEALDDQADQVGQVEVADGGGEVGQGGLVQGGRPRNV